MEETSIEEDNYSATLTSECKMRLVKVKAKSYCPSSSSNESLVNPFDDNSEDDFNISTESSQGWSSSTSDSHVTVQTENKKKCGKKKKASPSEWNKTKAKILRNSGRPYVSLSKSKKNVEERKLRPPCESKCRLHCNEKISQADRQKIFDTFWSTGNLQRQREFIAARMSDVIPKYRYSSTQGMHKHNSAFHFHVDGINIRVCKTFFKSTLDINDRVIRTVTSKRNSEEFIEVDLRGKHKYSRVSPEIKESVTEFIKAIPIIESHYLRNQTSREFIEGGKSMANLYRDYKESREKDNLPFANMTMFNRIFNNDFNISFFKPKKDQCDLCESYKNALDDARYALNDGYNLHIEEKELSRREKDFDKKKAYVAVYDMQAVLSLPKGFASAFYYKNKINCYNFTVSNFLTKVLSDFFGPNWKETVDHVKSEAAYYDISRIWYKTPKIPKSLTLSSIPITVPASKKTSTYFQWHTQNEGDNVHSVIEKQIKRHVSCLPIYIPGQYIALIATAKKTGRSYKVNQLSHKDFYDLKALQEEWGSNFAKNELKEKIVWNDIKILRVQKDSPESFFYKYSYKSENFMKANVRNMRTKSSKSWDTIRLKNAYSDTLPLHEKKKNDIMDLIKKNIIPNSYYEAYYKQILD